MVSVKTAPAKKAAKKAAQKADKKVARKVVKKSLTRTPVVAPQAPQVAAKPDVDAALSRGIASVKVAGKQALVRDSFTMPKHEYELLDLLKGRLMLMSKATKKTELLRAGVMMLANLSDADLLSAVSQIPRLKTGRPKKSKDLAKTARKKS